MFRIKRLYSFVLESFLPLLLATFSVCLFIMLMQFLWKYVDDMVGKGVDMVVLVKMFFHAGLSLIPLTLPLAILLASLMTFGNLGEHFELLAMKASGVSLLKIMRPLIAFICILAVIAFYFQNTILPDTQTKLWTTVLSLKQKSPELEIPEGSFYKEIRGFNVYVEHKDKKNGYLYDVMIYDYSKGFNNAVVIVADTGILKTSDDKKYLVLTLRNGESFQNIGTRKVRSATEPISYRRETFSLREILIEENTNFNMADQSIMGSREISKDLSELNAFIDSVSYELDSTSRALSTPLRKHIYTNSFKQNYSAISDSRRLRDSTMVRDFDQLYADKSLSDKISLLEKAKSKTEIFRSDYMMTTNRQSEQLRLLRLHEIEIHKKFTLSLACLLFFFIGAPLGAIIRKGGLGMPAVLSVIIFLLYFVIDTFGQKMAKQGVWPIWEGMWMSTFVLLGLGVFFTYKAVNDSVMLNPDAWKTFLQRFFGKREVRNYQRKEVIIENPDYSADINAMDAWNERCSTYLLENKRAPMYISFFRKGFVNQELKDLVSSMEEYIESLRNSNENLIIGKLMDFPIIKPPQLNLFSRKGMRWTCAIILPVGLIIYLIGYLKWKQTKHDLETTRKVNDILKEEIIKLIALK